MPQDSNIDPFLFIQHAYDISKVFKFAKMKISADEVTFFAVINKIININKLQNELNDLADWTELINNN